MRPYTVLSEEDASIALIAERTYDDWTSFCDGNFVGMTRSEFLDLQLGRFGACSSDVRDQHHKRECLFSQLVHTDARITPADEEELRNLRDTIRLNGSIWRGCKAYFGKLEEAVRSTFSDRPLSSFRCRWLATELSHLLMGYRTP